MDRNNDLKDLAQRASSLRAAIARLRDELASVNVAEQELVERLRTLGLEEEEESKTTVDRIAAGLPGHRRSSTSKQGPESLSTLKAGVAGAGLMLGVAVLVLLAVNLAASRRGEATVAHASSSSATTAPVALASPPPSAVAIEREIPPPPPPPQVEATATVAAVTASATPPPAAPAPSPTVAAAASGPSTMTVICTPKCDAISDNNVPLAPNSTVPVAPGSHKLVLSAPNGARKTMIVNVTPGQAREVRVAMDSPRDYGF